MIVNGCKILNVGFDAELKLYEIDGKYYNIISYTNNLSLSNWITVIEDRIVFGISISMYLI